MMRWLMAAVVTLWAGVALGGAALSGVVVDEAGKPLAGARVAVWMSEAARSDQSGVPWYYVQIGERAVTDGEGKFVVPNVDARARYNVLVCAEGRVPKKVKGHDPAKEVKVKLAVSGEARKDAAHLVKGKVAGPDGQPVEGALVMPGGIRIGEQRSFTSTGNVGGVDPGAITNNQGEFVLYSKEENVALDVRVCAKGLATTTFEMQPAGEEVHEMSMAAGASIHGRVVRNGEPVTGVVVVAKPVRQPGGIEMGGDYVFTTTDDGGKFVLSELTPDRAHLVFGQMKGAAGKPVLPVTECAGAGAGEVSDAGDLEAMANHVITGKLRLSDGKKVPAGTRVRVRRTGEVWDLVNVPVDGEGKFKAQNVPEEAVTLELDVKGYQVSPENKSYEAMNGALKGLVNDEVKELDVLLDPGEFKMATGGGAVPANVAQRYEELAREPLSGMEGTEGSGK